MVKFNNNFLDEFSNLSINFHFYFRTNAIQGTTLILL